jgi:hypothetical protein
LFTAPQREVRNLAVSPGQEDNSLVATWDKLTCQSDQPYIAKYNVRYNEVNNRHFAGQKTVRTYIREGMSLS